MIFVASSGGADSGTCGESSPCDTIAFALTKVDGGRNVIRLVGFNFIAPPTTTTVDRSVVIDASGSSLGAPVNMPLFDVRSPAAVTLEGGILPNGSITVGAGSSLRVFAMEVRAGLSVTNGTLSVINSKLTGVGAGCSGGSISVSRTRFDGGWVQFTNCQTTVTRSRFEPAFDGALDGTGGTLRAENNVFVAPGEFTDLIRAFSLVPGSAFVFNTIVNTNAQSVNQSPVAITCDVTLNVSSNIIAYNSPNPLYTGCIAHASLFDAIGAADAPGNPSGDPSTFFTNKAGNDFHLAAGSPARNIGVAGLVSEDYEGNARPVPSGSNPDVGAYEAP